MKGARPASRNRNGGSRLARLAAVEGEGSWDTGLGPSRRGTVQGDCEEGREEARKGMGLCGMRVGSGPQAEALAPADAHAQMVVHEQEANSNATAACSKSLTLVRCEASQGRQGGEGSAGRRGSVGAVGEHTGDSGRAFHWSTARARSELACTRPFRRAWLARGQTPDRPPPPC